MRNGSVIKGYLETTFKMSLTYNKKCIFYDGVNVMTRQLLDSQGPLTKKILGEVKELIEEFSKHSREYHNPIHDEAKGIRVVNSEDIATVLAMLDTMDRRMTKMDQSIHAIRVCCERCNDPHLIKDSHLDEHGNKKAQVCYSSGDKYVENWRKPKREWLPYNKYKKQKEEKYRQIDRGFYEKEQPPPEKKVDLESTLHRFMEVSKKRYVEKDAVIREDQNIMKEQQALLRSDQALIQNIEVQLGQLTTLVQDKLSPKIPEKKPQSQVMVI